MGTCPKNVVVDGGQLQSKDMGAGHQEWSETYSISHWTS